MINIFYITSLFFIWSNLYYILNYKKIDKPFFEREDNSKLDLIYYIANILFPIWIIIGLFTKFKFLLLLIILMFFVRFPLHKVNKKTSLIIFKLSPIINIILISYIFIKWITS